MNKDYEKIINYIYGNPEVPREISEAFTLWLAEHEDDEALTFAMLAKWVQELEQKTTQVDAEALTRLLNDVSPAWNDNSQEIIDPVRRISRWRKAISYAAVLAAVILSSLITYNFVSSRMNSETVFITAKGSTGEFTLPDGSRVLLNSDSRLSFDANRFMADGKRRVNISGGAFLNVAKDRKHPFVVSMQGMDVEVLGTSFDVRSYPDSRNEEVVLLSGKVKVSSASLPHPVEMTPDSRFVLNRESGTYQLENARAINYCRWIESKLKLENEPLGDLLITIGRKYNLELDIAPGVDLNQRLSLTLHKDDFEDLMPVVEYLTDISYYVSDNTLHIK